MSEHEVAIVVRSPATCELKRRLVGRGRTYLVHRRDDSRRAPRGLETEPRPETASWPPNWSREEAALVERLQGLRPRIDGREGRD